MLRRVLFALLCALALVGLTAGSASAGGPPRVGAFRSSNGELIATFLGDLKRDNTLFRVRVVCARAWPQKNHFCNRCRVRSFHDELIAVMNGGWRRRNGWPRPSEKVRRTEDLYVTDQVMPLSSPCLHATQIQHPCVGKQQRYRVVEPRDLHRRENFPIFRVWIVFLGLKNWFRI